MVQLVAFNQDSTKHFYPIRIVMIRKGSSDRRDSFIHSFIVSRTKHESSFSFDPSFVFFSLATGTTNVTASSKNRAATSSPPHPLGSFPSLFDQIMSVENQTQVASNNDNDNNDIIRSLLLLVFLTAMIGYFVVSPHVALSKKKKKKKQSTWSQYLNTYRSWESSSFIPSLLKTGQERQFNTTIMRSNETTSVTHQQQPIPASELSRSVLRIRRSSSLKTTLRLIILSDTHGFEQDFCQFAVENTNIGNNTNNHNNDSNSGGGVSSHDDDDESLLFAKLPDADVLIHAGDFFEGGATRLDAFLARQSHIPHKIVVRGNHDPVSFQFRGGAKDVVYAARRHETIHLPDGTILDLRPWKAAGGARKLIPRNADIVISHEPLWGILDVNRNDDHIGSLKLRGVIAETPEHNLPAVWICGHVHESRGAAVINSKNHKKKSMVVVINASNANPGRASHLAHGPVFVDLVPRRDDVGEDEDQQKQTD
jgi:predicted phosphodiesterase